MTAAAIALAVLGGLIGATTVWLAWQDVRRTRTDQSKADTFGWRVQYSKLKTRLPSEDAETIWSKDSMPTILGSFSLAEYAQDDDVRSLVDELLLLLIARRERPTDPNRD